jgi:hypothetical protein
MLAGDGAHTLLVLPTSTKLTRQRRTDLAWRFTVPLLGLHGGTVAVQCWLALASAYTEAHAPRNRPRHQVVPVLWVTLRVLYGNAPGIGRGMRPSTGGQGEVASNCTANSGGRNFNPDVL